MATDSSLYILPNDTDICLLECQKAFQALTPKEKLYAHYLSRASWYGSMVCLLQTSPESPGIYLLLQKLFRSQTVEDLQDAAKLADLSDEEFKAFLIYVAGFYANLGNYKSFGDTKFIPNLPQNKVEALLMQSKGFNEEIKKVWEQVADRMFSLKPPQTQLGLGEQGITTYFSDNCVENDAKIAQEFMTKKEISAYNTRLFKTIQGDETEYEVRLASSMTSGGAGDGSADYFGTFSHVPEGSSNPVTFQVTRGDYSPLMQQLVDNLEKAQQYAANEKEVNMIKEYIKSFSEGSIPAHKQGSRYWIQNQGPIVETYIGFIESYRDPSGARGEFEGMVAMVNKEMSAKFQALVDRAEHFLPLLPWPSCYEKDKFLRPDFTSLDVLSFASSGIPAGINIPNYDDIRQDEGFKNVSLGNVLSSGYKDTKVTFINEEDKAIYSKLKVASFEVQVGLHELLGHGSGKLFQKNADGTFNFDEENVHHIETGEKISSWYEAKETWDSKFQAMSSSYEECRAECVGIYLCLSSEILSIFGHKGDQADDIIYINWLNMVRAGLLALEFYTPESSKWRQAHMQARYVILNVLLEAGEGLVSVKQVTSEDGQPDVLLQLDRSKINTVGKKAIGDFLQKLQVYKSTADYSAAKAMYDKYSNVCDRHPPHFLSLRSIVLARKQPRKMFVQCNTSLNGDTLELKEYEASPGGLIKSFQERFPGSDLDNMILTLWENDRKHFP